MKALSENRRARFDYEILETLQAGIELRGFEVKSAKSGRFDLAGSYAIVRKGQVSLINARIPPYQPKNAPVDYDPSRSRRLLLRKEEISSLAGRLKDKSVHLVPLRAYTKNNLVKIELGLAKSKKKSDKREILKKRSAEREIKKFPE
jgi:SsrA-binding protein